MLSSPVGTNLNVLLGWTYVLMLLSREDVQADDVDLGVSMLARLCRGQLHNPTGTSTNDHMPAPSQCGTFDRIGQGSLGISTRKAVVNGRHDHFCYTAELVYILQWICCLHYPQTMVHYCLVVCVTKGCLVIVQECHNDIHDTGSSIQHCKFFLEERLNQHSAM